MAPNAFGARLADFRHRIGLSGEDLARQSGISRSVIANLENNRTAPRVDHIVSLASALGVTPAQLDPRLDPNNSDRLATLRAAVSHHQAAIEAAQSELRSLLNTLRGED